jgi:hypothetical protein
VPQHAGIELSASRAHAYLSPSSSPSPPHPPDINPVVDTSTMTKKLFHLGQAAKANGVINGAPAVRAEGLIWGWMAGRLDSLGLKGKEKISYVGVVPRCGKDVGRSVVSIES